MKKDNMVTMRFFGDVRKDLEAKLERIQNGDTSVKVHDDHDVRPTTRVGRIQQAAELREIYFSGEKKWLNNTVGYGYEFFTPDGDFFQANTLEGAYKKIMEYPKIYFEEEPKTYEDYKNDAREEAMSWQYHYFEADDAPSMSWGEYAEWYRHFHDLGKRYGLLKEFRENGIPC